MDSGSDRVDRLTKVDVRDALGELDPLRDELSPAEQARIVWMLVERVEIGLNSADSRLRVEGLAGLVRDLGAAPMRVAAA